MAVYKRGKVWWYKFTWHGECIRESTKQGNKRTAEQMEATHKASLAKGEVGIRERKQAPTLSAFLTKDFLPYVESTKASKANTVRFYRNSVANLLKVSRLADLRIDEITSESVAAFIAARQVEKREVSTINRDLATLKRALNLAMEWGTLERVPPRIRLLSGENHRERVITADEEERYLEAATAIGHGLVEAYNRALRGIRAVQRGQQPQKPDAFLLRDVATLLIDCGLRPEECFRLQWRDSVRDNGIEIHSGKGAGSRRRIPLSPRASAVLAMRKAEAVSEWVFPADTRSGHAEASTVKKQHARAIELAGLEPFVLYTFRHTFITRLAPHTDAFVLHRIAGHTDMNTTKRYVHPSEESIIKAMQKAQGGHSSGHRTESRSITKGNQSELIV